MTDNTQVRKADHIRICLEEDVQFRRNTTGFERYRFEHCCLPELDRAELDLRTCFLNRQLGAPILISSMTGGTKKAQEINFRLAELAQTYRLAMGVGSQRVAIEKPEVAKTFAIRQKAPDALLFANVGAVQLNYGYGIEECRRMVDLLEADALILHINPLQECIQPNGDINFKDLLNKIEQVCRQLEVPVIAKEVGNGISVKMVQKLQDVGITAIDVAGAGGTSWAKVESERSPNKMLRQLGQTFGDWGIPTAECVAGIAHYDPEIPLIASGGLRNGLDAAKAIALGADLAGFAYPFLKAATESPQALEELLQLLIAELTTVLFCTGNANFAQLQQSRCLQKLAS
ncbi:isopentenyl-diphosphate delta-isomerase [[Leptolyngbya] sp. PCC 7376]|uniref:type 2 isopentenyl-diphosphate Delta-isomerase n=1 Tax=[Leptolyngbya] sp. PCC 7376 TaxID=111781 RepID=UPI00029F315A|nr:type 2 isopentenyl-diphosphate Delta-isomerase [[Leptolyngbya] sp. PCC 7376]AFY36743.1 isopentenyl-diphosphate delta-isomerase [[Leptolyngbya] sp. PCC 7376]